MKHLFFGLLALALPFSATSAQTCASIDAETNLHLHCIAVGENYYSVRLDRHGFTSEPNGLFWRLGPAAAAAQASNCATVNSAVAVSVPCIEVGNSRYQVTLNRHLAQNDPAGFYWRLGDAQVSSVSGGNCSAWSIGGDTPVQLVSSGVFPGIVHDGNRIVVSYAQDNDLYIRPYSNNFTPLSAATRITSQRNVMDHKHVFLNGSHYLAYSTTGDTDLFLLKLDMNLAQEGETLTVASGSTNTRTNDMLLATVDGKIVVGQFRPSNLNNSETSGHLLKRYDTDLNELPPEVTLNHFAHTNTAAMQQVGDWTALVAPSATPDAGAVVRTQKSLLLLRYDSNFSPLDSSSRTLVPGSSLTHVNDGDGLWMSTGLAYDATDNCLLVGHTFADGATGTDNGKLYLRVFDGASYAETFSEIMATVE